MKRRAGLLIVAVFLLAGCSPAGSPADAGGDASDGNGAGWTTSRCLADASCPLPLVSAHRGLCGDEPENTLAAFLECQQLGVPMVELDPRQTADGYWVIMHDSDVTRTTNGEELFPGRVRVDELTLAEFQQLVIDDERCGDDPDADPARCHPPTLAAAIEGTSPQLLIDLDFKAGDPASVATLIEEAGASGRILFFDADIAALRSYHDITAGVVMPRAHDAGEVQQIITDHGGELALSWLHIDPAYLAEAQAAAAPAGVRLYLNAWSYNVDTWLYAAELAGDEQQRAELEQKAWDLLDELLAGGARGLGTDRAAQLSAHLYPDGFGN